MFSFFDVILIILFFGFVFFGLFFGLIRTIGGLIGVFGGAFLATRFYDIFFIFLNKFAFFASLKNEGMVKIIIFITFFFLIRKLISFGFGILNTTFNLISILPFLTTFNRVGGVVLGALEATLILGLILWFISQNALIEGLMAQSLIQSKIAPFLIKGASILLPLVPATLKMIKN